jgi:hypothetical protein
MMRGRGLVTSQRYANRMLSMTRCWACDTELLPEWKFCVHCGVPVEEDAAGGRARRAREPLSPIALFGWIFAGIGAVLLVGGIVLSVLQ